MEIAKAKISRNKREFSYPVRVGLKDDLYLEHARLVFGHNEEEYEGMTDIDEGLLKHFEIRDFHPLQFGDIFSISDDKGTREYFFLGNDSAESWELKKTYKGTFIYKSK